MSSLEEFVNVLTINHGTTYSLASVLTLCTYDMLLSLGKEVTYIWPSRWSAPKILYIIVRYYGFIILISITWGNSFSNPSLDFCRKYFLWTIAGGIPVFVGALDFILFLRIYALYNGNKLVTGPVFLLVIADIIGVTWGSTVAGIRTGERVVTNPAPWRGCATDASKKMLAKIVITFTLNQMLSLLFLLLSLWKMFKDYEDQSGRLTWRRISDVKTLSPLLFAFVRDGSLYFALTSVAEFLLILATLVVQGPVRKAMIPWVLFLLSHSGAHLILDLRAAGAEGNTDMTWNQTPSLWPAPEELHHGMRFNPTTSVSQRMQGRSYAEAAVLDLEMSPQHQDV